MPARDGQAAAEAQRTPSLMFVQVGAFGQERNAAELKQRLEQQGFGNVVIRYDAQSQPALYRVRVGPVRDASEYDAVVARVSRLDIASPRLVMEPTVAADVPPAGEAVSSSN